MIILPLACVFAFIGTFNSSEWLSKGVFLRQSAFLVLFAFKQLSNKIWFELNKDDFFAFAELVLFAGSINKHTKTKIQKNGRLLVSD